MYTWNNELRGKSSFDYCPRLCIRHSDLDHIYQVKIKTNEWIMNIQAGGRNNRQITFYDIYFMVSNLYLFIYNAHILFIQD